MAEWNGKKELKWGIMGCGMISNDFAHAVMRKCEQANVIHAVATANSLERAQEFVAKLSVPKKEAITAYGSYDELLANRDIEIIYVGILNQTHCRWVCACLDAGKHVLCEKPMALSLTEAEIMTKKAREKGLFLMEAFWSRFFPVWQMLGSIVGKQQFGRVKVISATFGTILPANRFNTEISECPALDIGIYNVMFAMFCCGDQKPSSVKAQAVKNEDGVDICGHFCLEFGGGAARANLMYNTEAICPNSAFVAFENGIVQIPDHFYCPTRIRLIKGKPFGEKMEAEDYTFPLDDDPSLYNFANSSGLRYEADHVFSCIRSGPHSPRPSFFSRPNQSPQNARKVRLSVWTLPFASRPSWRKFGIKLELYSRPRTCSRINKCCLWGMNESKRKGKRKCVTIGKDPPKHNFQQSMGLTKNWEF